MVTLPSEQDLRNGNSGNDLLLLVARIRAIVVRAYEARYVRRSARRVAKVVADESLNARGTARVR